MKKLIGLCLLVTMIVSVISGCGAGLYTEDEMNELHDVVGYVQEERRAFSNVITSSITSRMDQVSRVDNELLDFLSTRGYDLSKPFVALTYDDGPNSEVTPKILDLLEQYGGKATFFMVGDNLYEGNKEILQRMVKLGCQVGNHTVDHAQLTAISQEEARHEITDNKLVVEALSGVECRVMRPPYGSSDDSVAEISDEPFILWSVDTLDWSSRNGDSVFAVVKDEVYDGAIILMHDLYESTYEGSAKVIPWLVEQGYQLVTVSELAYIRGVTLKNGICYYDFYVGDYQ